MDNAFGATARLIIRDPESLSEGIAGASLAPIQLPRKVAPSELVRLSMPTSCLSYARLGPAMLFRGSTSDEGYSLVFVLDCPAPGHSFNFSTVHGDGYLAFFPPGGVIDAFTPAGYANISLTVSTNLFLDSVALHCPGIPDSFLVRGGAFRIPSAAQAPLRTLVASVLATIARNPDGYADPDALRLVEVELLNAFLGVLSAGGDFPAPAPSSRTTRREARLREARDFIGAHLDAPISVVDIGASVGLSVRGLENLFLEFLGVNPLAYLRQVRLHAAHRALLCPASHHFGGVKKVALDHGFWHQGRFSAHYRDLFGELPSETIAREVPLG